MHLEAIRCSLNAASQENKVSSAPSGESPFIGEQSSRPNRLRIHISCKCVRYKCYWLHVWKWSMEVALLLCILLLAMWNFQSVYFFFGTWAQFHNKLYTTDSAKHWLRKENDCNQKWVLMPNTCKCSKKPLDNES